jgi:hypothetical protein
LPRFRASVIVVAGLIGLALAAAVDALRGDGDEAERVPATVEIASPAADLRRAGVSGELYFTVRSGHGCRLRALTLPSVRDAASFEFEWCRFDVSGAGNVVAGPPCPGDRVEVRAVDAPPSSWRGCAPAWKPNGELTFVRAGDVVTPTRTLLRDVTRLARLALGEGSRLAVHELAWLSDTRLAAVVGDPTVSSAVIVIAESGRAVSEPIFVGEETAIQVSHDRREAFATAAGFVQVFDPRGVVRSQSRFGLPDVAAVADSPDGRWLALARPGNVCIYRLTEPPPRQPFPVACLPFDAVDLAWIEG